MSIGYKYRAHKVATANWESAKSLGVGLGLRVVPLPFPVLERSVVKFGGVCAYEQDFYESQNDPYPGRIRELNFGPFLGGELLLIKRPKYDVSMIGSYQVLTLLQGYFGFNASMKL